MKKLILVAFAFFIVGCGDEKKEPQAKVETQVVETTKPIQTPEIKSETLTQTPIDGKALFNGCISCHGQNGEKKALNVSNIIAWQSKSEIIEKLNGYKNGTYGGDKKAIMIGQVKALSDEKIEALADYISAFKN